MKKEIIAVSLAFLGISVSLTFSVETRDMCAFFFSGEQNFETGHDYGGFFIRVRDPEEILERMRHGAPSRQELAKRSLLPPGQPLAPVVESMASYAGMTPIYINDPRRGHSTMNPVPLFTTWRNDDPVACLRSFAQAAGLDVVVPKPGFLLIGPPAAIARSAVVVLAFPFDPNVNAQLHEAEELALFSGLPVRMWRPRGEDPHPVIHRIGLGYHRVPGELGTFIVVATEGFTSSGRGYGALSGRTFKAVLKETSDGLEAECVWGTDVFGIPAYEFSEDLTGDGVPEVLLKRVLVEDYSRDVLLSGSDGAVLAEFLTEGVAVQTGATGPPLISVRNGPKVEESSLASLLQYDAESGRMITVSEEAEVVAKRDEESGVFVEGTIVARMLAQIENPDGFVVYELPGMRTPKPPTGVEVVHHELTNSWYRVVAGGPYRDFGRLASERPEDPLRVLFAYIPNGFKDDAGRDILRMSGE